MLNILYCVDGGARGRSWLEYSIKSLLRHCSPDELRIFVASDSEYRREGTVWIDARPYIEEFGLGAISEVTKEGRHPSPMQIFRLAAPCVAELAEVDTVLYIDIDTEILSSDLRDLPWGGLGADVSALYEHSAHGNKSTEVMLASPELVGMMDADTVKRLKSGGYFNSGVMLMDLGHMRASHPDWSQALPHIVRMAVKHHRCVVDQDICNVVLTAKPMDPKFNVMPGTDVNWRVDNPCVLHYANSSKYRSQTYPPADVRAMVVKRGDPVAASMPKWLDKAYFAVACYTGYALRERHMRSELERVGIRNFHIHWGFPNPFEKILLSNIPHMKGLRDMPSTWGATLSHYCILKTAYELGCEYAFVMEDDCRFVKDVGTLWTEMQNTPRAWDILMLSNFLRRGMVDGKSRWKRCAAAMSASCYVCNRAGMRKLISLYEEPAAPKNPRHKMMSCDYWTDEKYLGKDMLLYVADPPLAVQAKCVRTIHGDQTFRVQSAVVKDARVYSA